MRTYLEAKAQWLSAGHRYRHTILLPKMRKPETESWLRLETVPSLPVPGVRHYRMPRSINEAADALCTLQPDMIEAGDPYHLAWAALRAGRNCRIPVVAYYHSDLPNLTARRFGVAAGAAAARYVAHLYRQFDMVFAPSMAMAAKLRALGVERVVHQPLGVDTRTFSPAQRQGTLRSRLGLPATARLVAFAGRFSREKQLPVLIDAVERLGHPYHLVLIGAGDALPPSSCYTCLEFERDGARLAALLADCDVFVHCGDQETFGLAIVEAMACGLPVVGMASGGVGELVRDSFGIRVESPNAKLVTEAIDAIFQCDLAALGQAARRIALTDYDWNRVFERLANRYDVLMDTRNRTPVKAEFTYATK